LPNVNKQGQYGAEFHLNDKYIFTSSSSSSSYYYYYYIAAIETLDNFG